MAMARLIVHLEHAILAVGLAMGSLQGLLIRASYVGITGIVLELCGRIALTVVPFARAQFHARHWP